MAKITAYFAGNFWFDKKKSKMTKNNSFSEFKNTRKYLLPLRQVNVNQALPRFTLKLFFYRPISSWNFGQISTTFKYRIFLQAKVGINPDVFYWQQNWFSPWFLLEILAWKNVNSRLLDFSSLLLEYVTSIQDGALFRKELLFIIQWSFLR